MDGGIKSICISLMKPHTYLCCKKAFVNPHKNDSLILFWQSFMRRRTIHGMMKLVMSISSWWIFIGFSRSWYHFIHLFKGYRMAKISYLNIPHEEEAKLTPTSFDELCQSSPKWLHNSFLIRCWFRNPFLWIQVGTCRYGCWCHQCTHRRSCKASKHTHPHTNNHFAENIADT